MKIDAYSEQKKAAAAYDEQQKRAAQIKGTVSGAALTQAVTFTKSDGKMELFAASSYASEAASADKKPKSGEEFADEAQAILDNMKAICNKMDTGEIVAMDEDGVDVNNTDTGKIVTVGEQIRIKLAAAGNERVYTADIDAADLKSVLGEGNAALAAKVLEKYNFPVTEDNINEICNAIDKVNELAVPDIQAESYLMNNNLLPTADNLYKAEHVSGGNKGNQPLSDAEWEEIKPQIEGMLEKAGIEASEENLREVRGLIENGTVVNGRSLEVYRQIGEAGEFLSKIGLHNNEAEQLNEMLADKMAATMVDGESAAEVNLSDEPVTWKKASDCVDILEHVSEEALKEFFGNAKYQDNLKGLNDAIKAVGSDGENKLNPLDYYNLSEDFLTDEKSLHTLKCLEELRLRMTFEAAYILEKNDIDVDTEEFSKLVEELSKLDMTTNAVQNNPDPNQTDNGGFGYQKTESDAVVKNENTDYRKVMYELGALKSAPCAAIGDAVQNKETDGGENLSLADIEKSAIKLQRQYKDADAAYETMSTQIRPDLGDRVNKAVEASTDNVLKELELDETDENRRAVRILAYNSMEITRERIEKVKKVDKTVNNILDRMTPDIALDMLRDGSDIMNSDIDELSAELDRRITCKEEMTTQSFAEYLYNENRRGSISDEERTEYMALYSIVNKLAKDDGKAVGQLVNQNLDATIGNLVTSYMISGAAGIDSGTSDGGSYENNSEHNNAKLGYYKELLSKLSELPKEAAQIVTDNELPHTINNLAAAGALYSDNAYVYKELKKADVNAELDRFIQNMDNKKELLADYDELAEQLKEAVNSAAEDGKTADIGLLRQLSSSMSVIDSLAKHNTFYVPYDSDRGTGAIRLSVIEDSDNAGSFTVDMEDSDGGHISVNAKIQDDSITAYVLARKDCGEALADVEKELIKLGFSSVRLSEARSEHSGAVRSGKPGEVETRKLFAAAKVFVEKLR